MYIKRTTNCDAELYIIQSLKQNNIVAMPNV